MADDDDCECEEEGGGEWMATFADLSTLLLTFFVLLLSFSNMDVVQFREMLGSVRDAFGVQKRIQGPVEAISSSPVELSVQQNDGAGDAPPHDKPRALDLNGAMKEQIEEYVENAEMQDDVEVELTPRGVVVRIKEGALYQSGSADLDEQSKEILDKIAEMQARFSDSMQIEGHTDNVPIKSRKYPSNWELSTARAIAALQYLKDEKNISADKLGVAGYADSKPIDTNDTQEGRDRNRRVEFVFQRAGPAAAEDAAAVDGAADGSDAAKQSGSKTAAFPVPMSTHPSGQ